MTLAEPLTAFLDAEEVQAARLICDRFGLDVTRTYQFHESAVARVTTGTLTSHTCPWDIDLDYIGEVIRVEVKFSQEFPCQFRAGTRPVFKWAAPKGERTEKASHVTVLLGIDPADQVHAWAVPSGRLRRSTSITVTSPRVRVGESRSVIDVWRCPPTQLLPEILRAYRFHQTIERTP